MIDEEGLQAKAKELIGRRLSDAEMDRACNLLLAVLADHIPEILHTASHTDTCVECGQLFSWEELHRDSGRCLACQMQWEAGA